MHLARGWWPRLALPARSQLRSTAMHRNGPLYLTVSEAARALALAPKTIRAYLQAEILEGIRVVSPRRWYERQAKGSVGHWRISLDSVERLLSRMYDGGVVPVGVRRRLRLTGRAPRGRAPGDPPA